MNKWNSRKLLATIAASAGIPLADLPEQTWWLVGLFVACQTIVDVTERVIDAIMKWRSE